MVRINKLETKLIELLEKLDVMSIKYQRGVCCYFITYKVRTNKNKKKEKE